LEDLVVFDRPLLDDELVEVIGAIELAFAEVFVIAAAAFGSDGDDDDDGDEGTIPSILTFFCDFRL
jgi:hypothetical protein